MTTYRSNNFNLWIIVNGNEQRIVNDTVYIPFGTEYAIRVRNNNDVRAQFGLEIDGLENPDRFVIGPHETVTIERFLEGNLKNGSRFKFVSENNAAVQNPGSSQNGKIRVKFWKELIPLAPTPTHWGYKRSRPWIWTSDDSIRYSTTSTTPFLMNASANSVVDAYADSVFGSCVNDSQIGATIEGSKSNQEFTTVSRFPVEFVPTVLELTLRGATPAEINSKVKYCSQCGTKTTKNANYCSSCGEKF